MKHSPEVWAEKRKKGIVNYFLVDGILLAGGPFAVVLQVVGYFLLTESGTSFGQYFSASRTWMTFFFHGTLFGGIMGLVNWRRNEKAYVASQDVR